MSTHCIRYTNKLPIDCYSGHQFISVTVTLCKSKLERNKNNAGYTGARVSVHIDDGKTRAWKYSTYLKLRHAVNITQV